jgi:predicted deacylase
MSDRPQEGLDRRDFLIASIATAGASAALAVSTSAANAQEAATGSGNPASGTVYTGDVIQGKKVVSALDVNDIEPGQKHFLYFQGVQMPTGQHWYVSVTVAKGAKPGKRVVLTSGVHGDEMSSIHTVQTVMNQLDPAQMSGTVMAVTDVARPAIESMQRRWPNQGRGVDLVDMNREWPGNENGATATSRHAGLLFNRLLRPNADFAIDFHTGTTGFEVAASILPRWMCPRSRRWRSSIPSARSSTTLHIPMFSITRLTPRASRLSAQRSGQPATWTSR